MAIKKLGTPDNVSKGPRFDGKGSLKIPVGTTSQRPTGVRAADGELRFNSTLSRLEIYSSGNWEDIAFDNSIVSDILVVGGGGGSMFDNGGGGGAGGFRTLTSYELDPGTYTVTVGSGGINAQSPTNATKGTSSAFGTILTSSGGGAGGSDGYFNPQAPGGSGAGGARDPSPPGIGNQGGYSPPEGNPGGPNQPQPLGGAGGGGANQAGASSGINFGGPGGAGQEFPANPGNYYAGGGGGGSIQTGTGPGGTGGQGGGGRGGGDNSGSPGGQNGLANTGGGAGGGGQAGPGFNGGTGVVIIAYPTAGEPASITGGTTSIVGSKTLRTFTGSGILSF
jgi:hypothetical protein